MHRTASPDLIAALAKLEWWENVKVESDTPGNYNVYGSLKANPTVFFLAATEGLEVHVGPSADHPWQVCVYANEGQEMLEEGASTDVPGVVSLVDTFGRKMTLAANTLPSGPRNRLTIGYTLIDGSDHEFTCEVDAWRDLDNATLELQLHMIRAILTINTWVQTRERVF